MSSPTVGRCADTPPRPEMIVVFPCSHVMQVAKYTYVPAYIHTYMYIHIYIPTYLHAYIHTCMHAYMHTCIHTHHIQRVHMHAYIHTCYMHVHTRIEGGQGKERERERDTEMSTRMHVFLSVAPGRKPRPHHGRSESGGIALELRCHQASRVMDQTESRIVFWNPSSATQLPPHSAQSMKSSC